MFKLEILSVTARTASILLDQKGAKYHLQDRLPWRLASLGEEVQVGSSIKTGVFLADLAPDRTYIFECSGVSIEFTTPKCLGIVDASDFGLSTDVADNQPALARAIAATPAGGTLRVPKGLFKTRPLFLKSDMTFLLDEGAIVSAVSSRLDWEVLPSHDENGHAIGSWEGVPERCYAAIVTAIDCSNLHITGQGTIDGGGDTGDWWSWPKETREGARRARTVHLISCDATSISGVQIQSSPSWTVHPYRCRGLTISNIAISNPQHSPNTDGLNPESCEDTLIAAVRFTVGDDCIAVKSGKRSDEGSTAHLAPTNGLSITNCLMEKGHGAVVLGSEMSGSITNVSVQNCEFDGTDRGIRIKTRRGRGGEIKGIRVRNILMKDVPAPFTVNAFYFCDHDGKSNWVQDREFRDVDCTTPHIADVEIQQIYATGVEQAGLAILGLPEAPVENVAIKNYQIEFSDEPKPGVPLMALNVPTMSARESFLENAYLSGQIELLNGGCKR